jgi:hypothetical protein
MIDWLIWHPPTIILFWVAMVGTLVVTGIYLDRKERHDD